MTNVSTPASFGHPEILPATKEEMPVVANLFELYAHDFSEFQRSGLLWVGVVYIRCLPRHG